MYYNNKLMFSLYKLCNDDDIHFHLLLRSCSIFTRHSSITFESFNPIYSQNGLH